jgi:hypothetical protein
MVTAAMGKAKGKSDRSSDGYQKYRKKTRENEELMLKNVRGL